MFVDRRVNFGASKVGVSGMSRQHRLLSGIAPGPPQTGISLILRHIPNPLDETWSWQVLGAPVT
jgi:hypothetical protein